MPTQCVIPAAGKGTRMRPLTHSLPKAMLPVAGKPTIYHIIDKVQEAGIDHFVIITGYLRELMEKEILEAYPHLHIKFVEQTEQIGLGHAVLLAEGQVDPNDPLFIVYGDTLFQADLLPVLESNVPKIGVYRVDDPRRFGIIETDSTGEWITQFVEKPDNPTTDLALPGLNYFPRAQPLFEALQLLIERNIKTKGEYQVTDAYGLMISEYNTKMSYFLLDAWYDAGTLKAMLDTNQSILQVMENESQPMQDAELENCEIKPPVYLAKGATAKNCKLGPFVSVAAGVQLENSELSNCIVDHNTKITQAHLEQSLIGRSATVNSYRGRLVLGDDCQVTAHD